MPSVITTDPEVMAVGSRSVVHDRLGASWLRYRDNVSSPFSVLCAVHVPHLALWREYFARCVVEEIMRAALNIKALDWDAIRRESFSLTPEGLFAELVRNAESLLDRREAEASRRRARLAKVEQSEDIPEAEEIPASDAVAPCCRKDRWIDLNEFNNISPR